VQLSVIVPVFNERDTVAQVLERMSESGCNECEWIVVDDGSTDGTTEVLKQCVPASAKLLLKTKNDGKSAAVRSALELAAGDWVIVQDADLEYDPADIRKLLKRGIEGGGMDKESDSDSEVKDPCSEEAASVLVSEKNTPPAPHFNKDVSIEC